MSRIRSVHPGLWTDERFASVAPLARLFFIGIWNECDDQGIFEWSPLKLKMRLLPADNADAGTLLAELASAGMVLPFDVAGRPYGAVRNFARYQRPKKPNAIHPAPEHALAFATAGSAADYQPGSEPAAPEGPAASEPVTHQLPTASEIAQQRKEEGGRKNSEADASGADAPETPAPEPKAIDLKAAIFASGVPLLMGSGGTDRNARSMLGRWRRDFGDGAVMDVLASAQAEAVSDAVPWITRTLEARYGNRSRPRFNDRPSGWAPRPGMAGAEPASLDD